MIDPDFTHISSLINVVFLGLKKKKGKHDCTVSLCCVYKYVRPVKPTYNTRLTLGNDMLHLRVGAVFPDSICSHEEFCSCLTIDTQTEITDSNNS